MARTVLLLVTVLVAIVLYYLLQYQEVTVELSISVNSPQATVWKHLRDVSNFRQFHPYVSVADTIKETLLDDEYGTTLADIQIVERPNYMPVDLSFITKRKTWTQGDKCFVEQLSKPSNWLYVNITTIISEEKPDVTKIEIVAYARTTRLFGQYFVSQATGSYQVFLESTKHFIEGSV